MSLQSTDHRQIQHACEEQRVGHAKMVSGAGHDANAIATKIPVGMVFIPSIGGKSHCPEEATHWQDIVTGCQIYFASLHKLDQNLSKLNHA